MNSRYRKRRHFNEPSREGCVVDSDRRVSDAGFHEPILAGITSDAEARLKEMSKERARRVGLSEGDIKKLYC
jgi:hypothetical protein